LFSRKKLTLRHKNGVHLYSSKNLKLLLKFSVNFRCFVQPFVKRNIWGICSSVQVLKGYMVRERFGTSDIADSRDGGTGGRMVLSLTPHMHISNC